MSRSPMVAFRVDASTTMGAGHVFRCLTLADALSKVGCHCHFIMRDLVGNLGDLVLKKGHRVSMLPAPTGVVEDVGRQGTVYSKWLSVDWCDDVSDTRVALGSDCPDWLVVDHYGLDYRWEKQMMTSTVRIMAIDDLADRHHDCSILLDQNLGRKTSDYSRLVPDDCIRLIGPDYALLRTEFQEVRSFSQRKRFHPELKRILISLGGSDSTNATGHILDILEKTKLSHEVELDIIMGATASFAGSVRAKAKKLPFPTKVSVNVGNIAERMSRADFAIGAAGSTSWERCCLGLPAIIVVVADNQRSAAQELAKRGAAFVANSCLEVGDILDRLLASDDFGTDLASMAQAGLMLVDGMGTARVIKELENKGFLF